MTTVHTIRARVTLDVKRCVAEAAQRELLTESLWLRRVVDSALADAATGTTRRECGQGSTWASRRACRSTSMSGRTRLQVRLRHEDRLLLQERASARGMPAATYLSALLRSHLRGLAPLPREELAALKRSVAELSAIGRNLNQIAKVAHQTGGFATPGRDEVMSMLKVCDAMRNYVKAIIRRNVECWESGYDETSD